MDTASKILLLDGATGTELDRRGVSVRLPGWSAGAITEAPEVLSAIHREYLEAGAGAITANTFRTHRRSLEKAGIGHEGPERVTRRAVELAREACHAVNPDALVLGSVAPLEDCYRPNLAPEAAACRTEHAEIIECLSNSVDFVLVETMNNLGEAGAAVAAARRVVPGRWMVSFCTRTAGPPGVLLSGEPLAPLLETVHDAYAVGVNCVAAPLIEPQVRFLRDALPERVRIMAYANVGYADESGNWVITDALEPRAYAQYARRWIEAGATIVGGCCGTTPDTIRAVAAVT